MSPALQQAIEQKLGTKVEAATFVGGGDINEARLLQTAEGSFFVKMNRGDTALDMFQKEVHGLRKLAVTATFRIPDVLGAGDVDGQAFLLLEYVEEGRADQAFWETFGRSLAELHKTTNPTFGLVYDNYIGRQPQPNTPTDNWPDFFIQQRLLPQIERARWQNRLQASDEQQFERLFQKLPDIFPDELPALIHGDLWSGNFLVDIRQQPVLIDPAISFSHRESDLAMTRLFGGFAPRFYESYHATAQLAPGFEERVPIYQLYPLLVHVTHFGGSYSNSVRHILRRF